MRDWPRQIPLVGTIAAFVVVAAFGIHPIGDSDFWFHLKTGQWIWETGQVPRTDFFSYTATGTRWINHEWLFQAILWPVYRLAGANGTIVAKVAVLLATFGLLFAAFSRSTPRLWLATAIVIGALVGCTRFTVRPDLAAYLCAAAVIFLGERGRHLWMVPVVQLLWVNSHGSFPLGVFLVAAYAPRFGRRGAVIAAATATVCLMNPYGFELVRDLFRHLDLARHIEEWQPTYQAVKAARGLRVTAFLALVVGAIIAACCAVWRRDWARVIVLVGLTALAWQAVRFSMLFAILASPLIAAELWHAVRRWLAPESLLATAAIAVLGLQLALLASVATNRLYIAENLPQRFRMGVAYDQLALRAAEHLNGLTVSGPLFNTYGAGGPIIWACWPKWRVFVDGRVVVYDESFLRAEREARSSPLVWQQLEARYDFRVALLETHRAGILGPLLLADPAWTLIYNDGLATIFVRR